MKHSIRDISEKGTLEYTHHYMITNTSCETAHHTIDCPAVITTLAERYLDCDLLVYEDGNMSILTEGKIWAHSEPGCMLIKGIITSPHYPGMTSDIRAQYKHNIIKTLPHYVWHYCRLAIGLNGDTVAG